MSNRKSLKRKSEEYIYELSDGEVSQIDNDIEICNSEAKILKIEGANDVKNEIENKNADVKPSEADSNDGDVSVSPLNNIEINDNEASMAEVNEVVDLSGSSETVEDISKISSNDELSTANDSEEIKDVGECDTTQNENESISQEDSLILVDICDTTIVNNSDLEVVHVNDTDEEVTSSLVDLDKNMTEIKSSDSDEVIPVYVLKDKEIEVKHLKDPEESENFASSSIPTSSECNLHSYEEDLKEIGEIDSDDTNEQIDENTSVDVLTITYHSETFKSSYHNVLMKFLSTFKELEIYSDHLQVSVKTIEKPTKAKKKRPKRKKNKTSNLFVLDSTPTVSLGEPEPKYASKFVIADTIACVEKTNPAQQLTCFNCGESHALKDCPIQKNYLRINRARQNFMSSKGPNSKRYHLEEDQKYGHLRPGKISNKLKKALGLRKDGIPAYVYGMRVLGYPPGWLEEAKIVHSNLSMFDIDGKHLQQTSSDKKGLDIEKIVEYPGFNVPLEKNFKDEYKYYSVPRYSKAQSKEKMIEHFNRLYEKENDLIEVCDMDVDNKEEEKTENKEPVKSLDDLEAKRDELLQQLEAGDSSSCEKEPNDSLLDRSIAIKSSNFGTPILKSCSPYATLPNPDNFSKGVSPVIDFENLPNSTGKYEQMSGVLTKVRTKLKKLSFT